jgi:hypothetical protein
MEAARRGRVRVLFGREMRLLRYSLAVPSFRVEAPRARISRRCPETRPSEMSRTPPTSQPRFSAGCRPSTDWAQAKRQIAENRTHRIDGEMIAAWRRHLEWLRIDLLQIWAAPCFDVDAYARVRYQIRLIIDTARNAGDPLSFAVLSSPRRRKRRQQRRGALLGSSSIAAPDGRYRAPATPMKLMLPADSASRDSSLAP